MEWRWSWVGVEMEMELGVELELGNKIYGVDREISNTCEDRFDEFRDEFNV